VIQVPERSFDQVRKASIGSLDRIPQRSLVVFEATGAYHRNLEAALAANGTAFAKVNPRQARRFAEPDDWPRLIVSLPQMLPQRRDAL
jgi:transposase